MLLGQAGTFLSFQARRSSTSDLTVVVTNFVCNMIDYAQRKYGRKEACDHRPRTVLNTSES